MTTSLIEQEQVETNRLMAEVESLQRRGYGERQISAAMARAIGCDLSAAHAAGPRGCERSDG